MRYMDLKGHIYKVNRMLLDIDIIMRVFDAGRGGENPRA